MKTFFKIALSIVNIASFVFSMLFGALGIFDLIFGPSGTEKLLKIMHIPISYNQMVGIGIVCITIMIVTYFVRIKLFGK